MDKKELREKILSVRNELKAEEAENKSRIIMDKLTSLDEYKNSNTVFVYMSFKNEVNTHKLIEKMLSDDKRVVIPYTDTKNTEIIPSEIKSLKDDLILNSFGYYEPVLENVKQVSPGELDLIIAPGVVFDEDLNRVGFGKGYYDRILSRKRKDAKVIAVAYEFQVVDEVPTEPHDIKMDMIITEGRMIGKK